MKDEALERRINKILAVTNIYRYPEPILRFGAYGYNVHVCPDCGKECLPRGGGFKKHYTAVHAPDQNRLKAKKIIKAVRQHDAKR